MLKKTLQTLRKNPIIIGLYCFLLLVGVGGFILVFPYYNKLVDFADKVNKNSDYYNTLTSQNMAEITLSSLIVLLFTLFILAFTVVYFSGFGNVLSQAVCDGKTSLKAFFQGIKKYFVKILLASLLFIAISFGFSFFSSFISAFVALLTGKGSIIDEQSAYNTQKFMTGIIYIITILCYSFILLWLPSLFIEKDDGVIVTLKKGFKAGVKRYKELVLITAAILMPSIIVQAFNYSGEINIFTPVYIALYVYEAIISLFFVTYIFELYNDTRKQIYFNDNL